ncbi:MAG: type I-E CRISPR-associated protein Cas6/Cse3/CasE [Anaerolineae bacterium]
MYLSRLILDACSRRVCREVSEPYEMHRTLLKAFPSALEGGPGRVLFRVDTPPAHHAGPAHFIALVQSEQLPDWSFLHTTDHYLLRSVADNPAVKSFAPVFTSGQQLLFRLRANPTVKRNGKRCGLYREEEQRAWLERKADENGFTVLGVIIQREGIAGGRIYRAPEEVHPLRLLAVRFDGLLRVDDPERFLNALRRGIGSGKGLGFGLLSLARPRGG